MKSKIQLRNEYAKDIESKQQHMREDFIDSKCKTSKCALCGINPTHLSMRLDYSEPILDLCVTDRGIAMAEAKIKVFGKKNEVFRQLFDIVPYRKYIYAIDIDDIDNIYYGFENQILKNEKEDSVFFGTHELSDE